MISRPGTLGVAGARYVHGTNAAIRAYATLGIDYTSSEAEVKRAYRAQLQRFHPDTGAGDVRALQSVTDAYRTLKAQYKGPYLSSAQWEAAHRSVLTQAA